MPLTITPRNRLVLSWGMFDVVPDTDIPSANGRAMDADTECSFSVSWSGSQVDVTVSTDRLKVRIGAAQTDELLKHEQGHADLCWLAGLAAGREILSGTGNRDNIITRHGTRSQAVQDRYDRNTEHGTHSTHQGRWNRILDAAILHRQTIVDGHAL
jgi:hypothetical protein